MMVANSLDLVCARAKTEPCSIRLSCCACKRGPHPLCKCRSAQDKKNNEYYGFHLKLFITKPFNGWDLRGQKHTLEVKLPCGKEEGELEIKTFKRSRRVDVSHDFLTHLIAFYQLCQRPCLPRQHEQVTSALERRLPSLLLNRMDVNRRVDLRQFGQQTWHFQPGIEWCCSGLVYPLHRHFLRGDASVQAVSPLTPAPWNDSFAHWILQGCGSLRRRGGQRRTGYGSKFGFEWRGSQIMFTFSIDHPVLRVHNFDPYKHMCLTGF